MGSVTACYLDVVTKGSGHQMTGLAVSVCLTGCLLHRASPTGSRPGRDAQNETRWASCQAGVNHPSWAGDVALLK